MSSMNLPAHIQKRIADRQGKASALMDAMISGGESYPRVSIKGRRFKLIDEGGELTAGETLDVVLCGLNPKTSKVWYDKPYNPAQENVRPACFSNDGLTPDPSVEQPFHDNCPQCPNNVLGSRMTPSGQQSKICNDVRYLAVVASADPSKVYGLTVPVSSLKAFRQYFKDLNAHGLIPEEVITRLSFAEDVSFPKLEFSHRGFVPEKHMADIEKLLESPEVKKITRSIAPPQLQAPKTEPALPVKEEVEEEAAAPTPAAPAPARRGRPPKAAKAEAAKAESGKDSKPDNTDAVSALEKELDSIFG